MAYEKQNWKTGDVVTSTKLNHMEDGIAEGGSGGTPIINTTRTAGSNNSTVFTFDKTFAEVKAMLDAGQVPVVKCEYESNGTYYNPVIGYIEYSDPDEFYINMMGNSQGYYGLQAAKANASGYPVYKDTPMT